MNLAASIVRANDFKAQGYLVADFFYSARGGSTETSHKLMLQSITYQLLSQDNELYGIFQTAFRRLKRLSIGQLDWTYVDFRSIMLSLTSIEREHKLKVLLLLDDLDESDAKVEYGLERQKVFRLLSSLCDSGSKNAFKIIALSRAERDVRGTLQAMYSIDMRDVNGPDIQKVVQLGLIELQRHMTACESDEQLDVVFPRPKGNTVDEQSNSRVTAPKKQGTVLRSSILSKIISLIKLKGSFSGW
jgi:hypothetical protein